MTTAIDSVLKIRTCLDLAPIQYMHVVPKHLGSLLNDNVKIVNIVTIGTLHDRVVLSLLSPLTTLFRGTPARQRPHLVRRFATYIAYISSTNRRPSTQAWNGGSILDKSTLLFDEERSKRPACEGE